MAEGHRAGRHTRCKRHGHHAGEKLFPHGYLLHSVVHRYRLINQRQRQGSGCIDDAAERLKLLLGWRDAARCAAQTGANPMTGFATPVTCFYMPTKKDNPPVGRPTKRPKGATPS
jgi:hypothetical protein